jgi:hypothetical protein
MNLFNIAHVKIRAGSSAINDRTERMRIRNRRNDAEELANTGARYHSPAGFLTLSCWRRLGCWGEASSPLPIGQNASEICGISAGGVGNWSGKDVTVSPFRKGPMAPRGFEAETCRGNHSGIGRHMLAFDLVPGTTIDQARQLATAIDAGISAISIIN